MQYRSMSSYLSLLQYRTFNYIAYKFSSEATAKKSVSNIWISC